LSRFHTMMGAKCTEEKSHAVQIDLTPKIHLNVLP
jgi:hypothetical protein